MKAGATVEEIHTEMIESEGAPGGHTITTGQNSWQQDFLLPEQTKEEANPDPRTGAITAGAAAEAIDTTIENRAVMDIEGKSGGGRTGPRRRTP